MIDERRKANVIEDISEKQKPIQPKSKTLPG
jgi:hypothetical protein